MGPAFPHCCPSAPEYPADHNLIACERHTRSHPQREKERAERRKEGMREINSEMSERDG